METTRASAWVDASLIDHLHQLREEHPHLPPLRMVATQVVHEGLRALDEGLHGRTKLGATRGGRRQSLTFSLPTPLHEKVVQVCEQRPEAGTPSAALHLVLWLGINRILENAGQTGTAA